MCGATYDEMPRYAFKFSEAQWKRYDELNDKNQKLLTPSEKEELKNLFEYGDTWDEVCEEFQKKYSKQNV